MAGRTGTDGDRAAETGDYRSGVHAETALVRAAHQPATGAARCRICDECYPCGPARMADRALDAFEARLRRRQILASAGARPRPARRDGRVDLGGARWARSSHCDNTHCVEVAFVDDVVAVRNSAEPFGPTLLHTRAEWQAFTAAVKAGEFDGYGVARA